MSKCHAYIRLMRLDRPIGAWLLLFPTLWGLFLAAHGHPPWQLVLVFVLGVWLTRSAGCIINDYWDRDIDPKVERTRLRPLASGELSAHEARIAFVVVMLLAASLVLFFLPVSTWIYAVVGAVLTIVYPLMKRVINAPQCVLGIAFSWGIPMAVSALGRSFDASLWLLWALAWVWPVAYDTQYALADREDDLLIGVRSTAIALGKHAEWVVMALQGLVLFAWLELAFLESWQPEFLYAWLLAVAVLFRQWFLMKEGKRTSYTHAFKLNKWMGLFLLVSMLTGMR